MKLQLTPAICPAPARGQQQGAAGALLLGEVNWEQKLGSSARVTAPNVWSSGTGAAET